MNGERMKQMVKILFEKHPTRSILETRIVDRSERNCSLTNRSFLEIRDFDRSKKSFIKKIIDNLRK